MWHEALTLAVVVFLSNLTGGFTLWLIFELHMRRVDRRLLRRDAAEQAAQEGMRATHLDLPEREAHEAMKQRSAELQAAKLAGIDAPWPTHVEHPLADPAGTTQAVPVIKPDP